LSLKGYYWALLACTAKRPIKPTPRSLRRIKNPNSQRESVARSCSPLSAAFGLAPLHGRAPNRAISRPPMRREPGTKTRGHWEGVGCRVLKTQLRLARGCQKFQVLIPMKVGRDSELNPVTDSEVKPGVFGAQQRSSFLAAAFLWRRAVDWSRSSNAAGFGLHRFPESHDVRYQPEAPWPSRPPPGHSAGPSARAACADCRRRGPVPSRETVVRRVYTKR
jgi:hypothetical protein